MAKTEKELVAKDLYHIECYNEFGHYKSTIVAYTTGEDDFWCFACMYDDPDTPENGKEEIQSLTTL